MDRAVLVKPEGHHCFACGTTNPIGLNLQFYVDGDWVCSDVCLGRDYEGWENMVHGGIISAIVDEVMSWAGMVRKRAFLVTRRISLKYIRPVPTERSVVARGRVTDAGSPPKVRTEGEIRDAQGRLLVKGSGEFVIMGEEDLSLVPQERKRVMAASVFGMGASGEVTVEATPALGGPCPGRPSESLDRL